MAGSANEARDSSGSRPHPLAPLSAAEFLKARDVILKSHHPNTSLIFRSVYLFEPKKADLVPYLIAEHAGKVTQDTTAPPRQAKVQYDVIEGDKLPVYTQSVVDLGTEKEVRRNANGPQYQTSFTASVCLPLSRPS
jgi:primary-amine oxidase